MTTLMHCGSEAATRAMLDALPLPEPRSRHHHPIPHDAFADMVLNELRRQSYDVQETRYYLNREGNQMFGLARINPAGLYADVGQPLVGFRNSHDMSISAGVALGLRVFVCDNMSFSGEILIHRKHTAHILNDLPPLLNGAVSALKQLTVTQEQRIAAYRNSLISEGDAARILLEAHALKIVNASKLQEVWHHHRTDPLGYDTHPDQPTYWRLYNSITRYWKRSSAQLMGPAHRKSLALHSLLDEEVSHQHPSLEAA